MMSAAFKKTIFISLLGHMAVFSIFSFSFGGRISKLNYAGISFLGPILRSPDFRSQVFVPSQHRWTDFCRKPNILAISSLDKGYALSSPQYLKPAAFLSMYREKIIFIPKEPIRFLQKKKESAIVFHPYLPYDFLIYFKDRQRVHIELMFNIISNDKTSSIAVKRRISSGNLEADLLSMRYISHYLFIQQARFAPNSWQTVKIDLSAKSD